MLSGLWKEHMTDEPNVLFVFSDQHRGMDVGYAGNPDVRTPNLDRLASEGMSFPNAYANTPVCGPSRASLLTGQYPLSHTVVANDLPLPTEVPSVAKAFADAGYRTGYIGKWHLDGLPRDRWTPPGPRRQGFDDFWATFNCSHAYFDATYYRDDPQPIAFNQYEPIGQTDLALEFLEGCEQPFCLFLSYGPPHAPYDQVPTDYTETYEPDELAIRPNAEPTTQLTHDAKLAPRETIAHYYSHITAIDEQVGRLLDYLGETGLEENTIVAYSPDHGDMLWSHGYSKKEQPWEESINIPFAIRWPGEIPADTVERSVFSIVDMAPTLLSLADVTPPEAMEGTDYTQVMRGGDATVPDSVFLSLPVPNTQALSQGIPIWRGVRTERYTYARLRDGTPWVLYDNEEDPYQLRNLALQRHAREMREGLDATLNTWLEHRGDEVLSQEELIRTLGLVEDWNDCVDAFPALQPGGHPQRD